MGNFGLDGPERIHNKRRMMLNGRGTYRVIIENIKTSLKLGIHVTIRILLDKDNSSNFIELFQELRKENIFNKVCISIGRVVAVNNICKSYIDRILTTQEIEEILANKEIQSLYREQFNKYRIEPNLVGCMGTSRNSWVVDPNGDLYKCLRVVGRLDQKCGSIYKPNYNSHIMLDWLEANRLLNWQCQDCSMVPICGGDGCAYDFVINKKKRNQCDKIYNHSQYLEKLKFIYNYSVVNAAAKNKLGGENVRD
jgi:uncharacterized protein